MWRELLRPLAVFDWLTPASMLARRIVSGPSHAFLVPEAYGRSGGEVVTLLRREGGIRSWGYMVIGRCYYFRVPRADAVEAQRILDEAGLPTINKRPQDQPWARQAQAAPQRPGLLKRMGWM